MIIEQICFKDIWHIYFIEWTAFVFGAVASLFVVSIMYIIGKRKEK